MCGPLWRRVLERLHAMTDSNAGVGEGEDEGERDDARKTAMMLSWMSPMTHH